MRRIALRMLTLEVLELELKWTLRESGHPPLEALRAISDS